MRQQLPAGYKWAQEHYSDIVAQVTPLRKGRAVLWLSQRFLPLKGETRGKTVQVTSSVTLERQGQQWKVGTVKRQQGLFLESIYNRSGKAVAVVRPADAKAPQVAVLNPTTLTWEVQGTVPGPFAPATGWVYIREFLPGQQALVVNVGGETKVLGRTLSSDAVFYSLNWGKTWHRLKMPGSLGLMGLDDLKNRVFWSPGESYETRDPLVYGYDLK